jgi:hypothetical protein
MQHNIPSTKPTKRLVLGRTWRDGMDRSRGHALVVNYEIERMAQMQTRGCLNALSSLCARKTPDLPLVERFLLL